MSAADDRYRFDQMINEEYNVTPAESVEETPYGGRAYSVKPGLTKRGKVALAIGATVIAGGGMLTWQHYNTQAQATEIQAQELQYKNNLLALEMQKELNKAHAADQKAQETFSAFQQKQIDACVDADKGLIGKQLGVTYQSVTKDCRAQYGADSDSGPAMEEAASATDATGEGGISPAVLLGIGTGAALLIATAANRGKKNNAA
ncbi:hypothetical protein ACGFU4_36015 [Streptomyces sp. NPDC048511]|uniref:hypothetical protein n=1 Tax=Streptomyces sp. NPDC048511 TaxID=3365562 RepID=UPI00371B3BB0